MPPGGCFQNCLHTQEARAHTLYRALHGYEDPPVFIDNYTQRPKNESRRQHLTSVRPQSETG